MNRRGRNIFLIKSMRFTIATAVYSLLLITYSFSQTAKVTLDTTRMRLGEQAHLNLTLTLPSNSEYTFPAIPGDTIHKLKLFSARRLIQLGRRMERQKRFIKALPLQ